MKLKLTELTEKITPLPWKVTLNGGISGNATVVVLNDVSQCIEHLCRPINDNFGKAEANAAYLVHSVNTLPKLVEALESDLRIFKALVHDTNPHNDLNRGDSIDYDAACLNVERVEAALTLAREVEI